MAITQTIDPQGRLTRNSLLTLTAKEPNPPGHVGDCAVSCGVARWPVTHERPVPHHHPVRDSENLLEPMADENDALPRRAGGA